MSKSKAKTKPTRLVVNFSRKLQERCQKGCTCSVCAKYSGSIEGIWKGKPLSLKWDHETVWINGKREDVAENHGVTGLSVIEDYDLAYSILCSAARLVDKHTTLASGKYGYSYHVKDSAGELTAEVKTWWHTLDIPFSAVVLGDKDDDDHPIFEDFCLEVNAPSDSGQKTINDILQENGILQTSQKVRISFGD